MKTRGLFSKEERKEERKLELGEICILRAWIVKAESSLSGAPESPTHRWTISNISKRAPLA